MTLAIIDRSMQTALTRREQVARLWSGQNDDGKCHTAAQIAETLGIEPKTVYRHLRKLRAARDARAHHRPEYGHQSQSKRQAPVLRKNFAAVITALALGV